MHGIFKSLLVSQGQKVTKSRDSMGRDYLTVCIYAYVCVCVHIWTIVAICKQSTVTHDITSFLIYLKKELAFFCV